MEAVVVKLEDVINYLFLATEIKKPFVNRDNLCVALRHKTTESPCTLTTNDDPKLAPKSRFIQAQERRMKDRQGRAIQSLLDALLPE